MNSAKKSSEGSLSKGRRYPLLMPAVVLAAILASMWNIGFFDGGKFSRGIGNLGSFFIELFPPNFNIIDKVSWSLVETFQMAFLGTMIGFIFALPLGILGARNLFSNPITGSIRLLLGIVRTIPSLLWAVIFVVAVGLGPLAGTLGLASYTLGYLGKLYYEAIEAVDPEVLEGVKGTGSSTTQLIRYAVIPESANAILSQLLFMFEYNVRSSSILGFVGAGGVGVFLLGYIQTFQYKSLLALILLTLGAVLVIDFASRVLRDRFLITQKR